MVEEMLPKEQIRHNSLLYWLVGRARGSEGALPGFSGCKGAGGRISFANLQHFVNVAL